MSEDGAGALGFPRPVDVTPRTILGWVALAGAFGEVADAFFIEVPLGAVVAGLLFLVGWLLLRRGGWSGVMLVGVLCAIELVGLPFYDREDADDWIFQASFLVLGIVGVLAAVGALWWRRGDPA